MLPKIHLRNQSIMHDFIISAALRAKKGTSKWFIFFALVSTNIIRSWVVLDVDKLGYVHCSVKVTFWGIHFTNLGFNLYLIKNT